MDINNKNHYSEVLYKLADVYISLFLVDLQKDQLIAIKSNPFFDGWLTEKESVQDKTNNVMVHSTALEHVQTVLDFVDLSTLDQRMEDRNNVSLVFLGKFYGWCRARFIEVDRESDGTLHHVIFAIECVNEEKSRENHLLYLSQTDLMTGIRNRGYGEESIRTMLQNHIYGLFGLFDLDKFKLVNDQYGHRIGDQALIAVADAMKKVFSEKDVVLRLGGDEFAFYVPGVTNQEAATELIDKLFDEIRQIHISPMKEQVSISLGAVFSNADTDFDELYRKADAGVYSSKGNIGCSVEFCK